MHLTRAVGLSILAYIASFVVGALVMIVFDVNLAETKEVPPLMWYIGAFAAVIFAGLFTLWYFRSPKTTPNVQEGFRFGLVMIATGFALDFVTFIPLLAHENPLELLLPYYGNPVFWITLALLLATTTLTGKRLEPGRQEML